MGVMVYYFEIEDRKEKALDAWKTLSGAPRKVGTGVWPAIRKTRVPARRVTTLLPGKE
jgi:hypothetical protein